MKKLITIILALALLCACGAEPELPVLEGAGIEGYHEENEFEEKWGLKLSVKDVTSKGLTLVFEQSGGEPTGELDTGSPYSLERYENGEWAEVEMLSSDVVFCWTDIALFIFKDGETEIEENWEYFYGELPAGIYRIGKEVTDFRDVGDYDNVMFYAEFILE